MTDLRGMSAAALEELAKRAAALAADLRKEEPTYELALENGIEDRGYSTVRWGFVPSFAGTAEITMADGRRWRAIGHGPEGTAEYVSRRGWIEFVPVVPEIHYWGFALSSGDEVLNPSIHATEADRDAALEASGFGDHPHACQGSTSVRCETCQTYWHSGRRLGVGCGDCR